MVKNEPSAHCTFQLMGDAYVLSRPDEQEKPRKES